MVFGIGQHDQAGPQAWTRRLVMVLAAAILGLYVAFGCLVAINTHNRLDPAGSPLFYDFSAFYQAAAFADSGHAAAAYDDNAMIAAEKAAFPGTTRRLPWSYPPTFQLALMPLAGLPYVAAGLLWSICLYGLYGLLARRLVHADQLWLVLLFTGAAVNLLVGQNGLLTTVLIGAGVLSLRGRPLIGGALLGLMAYKPHFALLVPVVLIAGKEWRALGAAALAGLGLMLLSGAVLGIAPWIAFVHKAVEPSALFHSSSSNWRTIPSVLIMARSLGLAPGVASALHWTVAAAAAVGAVWTWRKTADPRLRAGVLGAATLIVSPYLRPYDLALLILPMSALLTITSARRNIGELAVLCAAWVLPAILVFAPPDIQFGPVVVLSLTAMLLWRVAKADDFALPGPLSRNARTI